MMRVSFPGRAGDILWALPSIRALAAVHGPVHLTIAGEFASMLPLLQQQPYLFAVYADRGWSLTPPNEWLPPTALPDTVHLGYRGWPDQPLAQYTYATLRREYPNVEVGPLDLETPWLHAVPLHAPTDFNYIAVGFTAAWFELKYGLVELLDQNWNHEPDSCDKCGSTKTSYAFAYWPSGALGSRWVTEGGVKATGWLEAAQTIATTKVLLGCCSALHVLAVALGKPCVIVEPMEARWNPIFYPLGTTGRVRLVTGNDGLPTFDARHVADVLREVLRGC